MFKKKQTVAADIKIIFFLNLNLAKCNNNNNNKLL